MNSEHTPVEQYLVAGTTIYVKRDDMFMKEFQPECPALAKLRGASMLLRRLQKYAGVKKVGVFDTRVSHAGQGIAFISRQLGLECEVGFPLLVRKDISESHKIAERLGAKLYPLKAGRTAVCYSQFKKHVEENGHLMLPLGLVCRDTVSAICQEAMYTCKQMKEQGVAIKTIVVCTGTGTIATGIHLGASANVIGVSCGMSVDKQVQRMKLLAFPESLVFDFLKLIPPEYDYYTALNTSSCPFPTSPYYDMKAWEWMVKHLDLIEQPVMFWNIGY